MRFNLPPRFGILGKAGEAVSNLSEPLLKIGHFQYGPVGGFSVIARVKPNIVGNAIVIGRQ